jgi:hypothetical protein
LNFPIYFAFETQSSARKLSPSTVRDKERFDKVGATSGLREREKAPRQGKSAKGIFMTEDAQSRTPGPNKLPKRYLQFQKRFPKVFQAYDALGATNAEAGSLTNKIRAPVKLAIVLKQKE